MNNQTVLDNRLRCAGLGARSENSGLFTASKG
jgi:hypothetical protein